MTQEVKRPNFPDPVLPDLVPPNHEQWSLFVVSERLRREPMDDLRPSGPADWPADLCAWAGGLALAVTIAPTRPSLLAVGVAIVLAAAAHTAIAWPVHLCRRRYGRGTLPELRAL